jgi:hypothetical protein
MKKRFPVRTFTIFCVAVLAALEYLDKNGKSQRNS